MKATFFLAIALLAAVVSAGDINQVQQGGSRGSDSSAKGGLVCITAVAVHNAVAHIYYVYRLVSELAMVVLMPSVAPRKKITLA